MDEQERKFQTQKNILDNKHNEYLLYMEIIVISLITAIVSVNLFYLGKNDTDSIIYSSAFGAVLLSFSIVYFQRKLKEIEQKINSLSA